MHEAIQTKQRAILASTRADFRDLQIYPFFGNLTYLATYVLLHIKKTVGINLSIGNVNSCTNYWLANL